MQGITTTNVVVLLAILTTTLSIASVILSLTAVGTSSVLKPKDGIDCFDINGNGKFDPETEDFYKDGIANYRDCSVTHGINGINGTNGDNCWDINGDGLCNLETEDINFDMVCNQTDCFSIRKCIDCYDLNGNFQCDLPEEDIDRNGVCDAKDCR